MTYRQTKLPFAFRLLAAGSVVLWLAGVSACNLEWFFCCESDRHDAIALADDNGSHHTEGAEGEAHHARNADAPSHGSHRHDGNEDACCSTLKAIVQIAKPIVVTKPAFQPVALLCVLSEARISVLNALHKASDRPPPCHEWVFTPEVCTGPANRAHGPPTSV